MLPEPAHHAERLHGLLSRFRREERFMRRALQELQQHLDLWQREACHHRIESDRHAAGEALANRCAELESECDHLATELAHVRLAIAGADEELANHGRSRAISA